MGEQPSASAIMLWHRRDELLTYASYRNLVIGVDMQTAENSATPSGRLPYAPPMLTQIAGNEALGKPNGTDVELTGYNTPSGVS